MEVAVNFNSTNNKYTMKTSKPRTNERHLKGINFAFNFGRARKTLVIQIKQIESF